MPTLSPRVARLFHILRGFFLAGEIGGDSEPHDFIQILVIGERKQLVIQLEKQAIAKSESGTFYLGGLKIADAVVLP